ncbi:hypothetical protein [uncultured Tateyamaria sp.]|uniref:hypothetical protein n=1 Tax=uncultured Tateyamaria sp. TaxID=455651 RepID=UPI002614633B|nr:hypothetical protein [uncultured Tateyamaria sp.]
MRDPELDILIEALETRSDLSIADLDGVYNALTFLLPGRVPETANAQQISTADGAMLIADGAFPNWVVHIQGQANDRDGHWRCTLRESDARDNDAVIGRGRSPVLGQAILAAVLRLGMTLEK